MFWFRYYHDRRRPLRPLVTIEKAHFFPTFHMFQHPFPVIYRISSRSWPPRDGIIFLMHCEGRHSSWPISTERHSVDIDELIDLISELGFVSVSTTLPALSIILSRASCNSSPGIFSSLSIQSSLSWSNDWRRCMNSHLGLQLYADLALDQMT